MYLVGHQLVNDICTTHGVVVVVDDGWLFIVPGEAEDRVGAGHQKDVLQLTLKKFNILKNSHLVHFH